VPKTDTWPAESSVGTDSWEPRDHIATAVRTTASASIRGGGRLSIYSASLMHDASDRVPLDNVEIARRWQRASLGPKIQMLVFNVAVG
jgi:hypothetical protein